MMKLSPTPALLDRLDALLRSESGQFQELAAVAGLDPKRSFRKADLSGLDLSSADLSGFDFSGADLRRTGIGRARVDVTTCFVNARLDDPDRKVLLARGFKIDGAGKRKASRDFDIKEVHRMILEGRTPPRAWVPHIMELDFTGTTLSNVKPLSGLTALRSLNLSGTPVGDVSGLSRLNSLMSLDLSGTQVADVIALLGFMWPRTKASQRSYHTGDLRLVSSIQHFRPLDLNKIQIKYKNLLSDILIHSSKAEKNAIYDYEASVFSAHAQLFSQKMSKRLKYSFRSSPVRTMRKLYLSDTAVSDLTFMPFLSNLQDLDLRGTRVTDLAALSGMTTLQSLDLASTRVSDVSALASLNHLEMLDLSLTNVRDVSPLGGLISLTYARLVGTQVNDVSALSSLQALEILDLCGTPTHEYSALSNCKKLQLLILRNTKVSDVSTLSGLTTLLSLDLRGTQVEDLAPLARLKHLNEIYVDAERVAQLAKTHPRGLEVVKPYAVMNVQVR